MPSIISDSVDHPNLQGEVVRYADGDTTLTGYVAYDKTQTGTRPGVLVVHEWWGPTDYVRRRARMLAALGYTGFALDLYGEGRCATTRGQAEQLVQQTLEDPATVPRRFQAAHEFLQQHATTDATKTCAIGYCFGGAVVLGMARRGYPLDAVASFHGVLKNRGVVAQKGGIQAKILVLNGAEDPMVPPEDVEAFRQEMTTAGADFEIVDYPGVVHGFTNPEATARGKAEQMPLAYDENADVDSWSRLTALLSELYRH